MVKTLAQRYNPEKWEDYFGQSHVKQLLIKSLNKPPGSIMITGTTGVGKTSLVNLYIKSVICENRKDNDINPCGICESCKLDIKTSGRDKNVIWVQAGAEGSLVTQLNDAISQVYLPKNKLLTTRNDRRFLVLDEVHLVPKDKLAQLLFLSECDKVIEENEVTFIFITMDEESINENVYYALKSRCGAFYLKLKTPSVNELKEYIKSLFVISDSTLDLIIQSSYPSYRSVIQTIDYCTQSLDSLDESLVATLLGFANNSIRLELWDLLKDCSADKLYNYSRFKSFWETLESRVDLDLLFIQLEKDIENSILIKPRPSQLIALQNITLSHINKNINKLSIIRSLFGLDIIEPVIFQS